MGKSPAKIAPSPEIEIDIEIEVDLERASGRPTVSLGDIFERKTKVEDVNDVNETEVEVSESLVVKAPTPKPLSKKAPPPLPVAKPATEPAQPVVRRAATTTR